jgi:hypothetical protein
MNPPATSASATAIPFKPAEDPGLPSGPQWGLAIVLCALALGAALYLLRRRGGKLAVGWKRQGGLLDVVESRALSPQAQLHVVRYGSRQLLLSVGPAGTQCLRDDPVDSIDAGAAP